MEDAVANVPLASPHWPCGPDCEYGRPMPGAYGDWHWCHHPRFGGRLVRDGHDCRHFKSATTVPEPGQKRHWLDFGTS